MKTQINVIVRAWVTEGISDTDVIERVQEALDDHEEIEFDENICNFEVYGIEPEPDLQ